MLRSWLLAVVAGVSITLAAAVVLVWLSLRHRPGDVEILSEARRLRLRATDVTYLPPPATAYRLGAVDDVTKHLEHDPVPPGQR